MANRRTQSRRVAGRQTTVRFGNRSPQMQRTLADGSRVSVAAEHLSVSVTLVEMRSGFDDPKLVELALSTENDRVLAMIGRGLGAELRRYAVGVSELEQIVSAHTGGGAPSWVTSSDPGFARALAKHFGCPVGEPVALVTNVGRDVLHDRVVGVGTGTAGSIALADAASATTPAATDTTLAGKLSAGGLAPLGWTYAHTAGTNTATLTVTFTANGSETLPVTVSQIGVFSAAVGGGTLLFKTALAATATIAAAGDSLTVTETVSLN